MKLRQLSRHLWEIPREGGMRVPARVYWPAGAQSELHQDQALQQLIGVAHLPGIVGYALAMPDIHWGYGFPIGGGGAVDGEQRGGGPGGGGHRTNPGGGFVGPERSAGDSGPARDRGAAVALYA